MQHDPACSVSGPEASPGTHGPLMRVRERFAVYFWEDLSHDVAQAVGMVSAQAECNATHALDLITERARLHHETLDEVAAGVLDRSIRFDR